MLDVTFINLISAGIARFTEAPGPGGDAPPAADAFIRDLLDLAPEPARRIVDASVERLWQACRAVGLPAEIAEPHIASLPGALARFDLTAADRSVILDASLETTGKAPISDLSSRIVAASRATTDADDALDDTVLGYLLETFLVALAASRGDLLEIRARAARASPAEGLTVDPQSAPDATEPAKAAMQTAPTTAAPTTTSASKAALTLAKIERADALGISVPLLEVLTVSLINITRSADLRHGDLTTAAAEARAIAAKLENLGADAPEWAAFFAEALVQFQSGRPRDCDRTLAAAEDSVVRRSIEHSPQNPVLNQLSIAIRSVRADLHALDGDFIKAARCHGFAGRYIPRADFALRWHHASQEARYYELSAYYESAPTGLDNAARTLTSAIAALPAGAPAVMRACAQANLARILMFLGEKEQQNDRFQLAAQLLRDAGVAFAADEADESGRAAVNCLLADALARLGESYSDPGLLEQAIHHYQSAYARPHEPAMADDEMTHDVAFGLRARHAIALISYAEITSNNDLHSGAIAAINDELPAILSFVPDFNLSGYARTIVAARCHRALAGWFESRGDEASATTHHTEAAAEYERVGFDAPALWIRQAAGLPPAPQRSLDALTRNATSPRPASGNSKADAA